ncbi:hypothetical protein, partial [Virgibacillus sp. SK37]|uniref:hypothetical protein n=1 Tax=Virgibacillus sp. SK37 TaxID=403957 RepID=UPI001B313580
NFLLPRTFLFYYFWLVMSQPLFDAYGFPPPNPKSLVALPNIKIHHSSLPQKNSTPNNPTNPPSTQILSIM